MADDLRHVRDTWTRNPTDAAIRRDSGVLRRLLVDGDLQRAWKGAGFAKEPKLAAYNLHPAALRVDPSLLLYASAGGALYKGAKMAGFMVKKAGPTLGHEANQEPPIPELISVSSFLKRPCLLVGTQPVSRRAVVKYVANKRGGAHFDTTRQGDDAAYRALDTVESLITMNGLTAVFFELLSIGQALSESADLSRFLTQVAPA